MTTLTKNQTKQINKTGFLNGEKVDAVINIRYDDKCGNGHNSFAITADIYKAGRQKTDRNLISAGCCHDEIIALAPELEPLIKWHLCSSDGPMHYVANTIYHARETDTANMKPGDPIAWSTHLKFNGFPMTFKQPERGFFDYLEATDPTTITIESVKHYDNLDQTYKFADKYTFSGFDTGRPTKHQWAYAPFDTEREAREFLAALIEHGYELIQTPTKWCQAVKPDLKAARSCAIWPDATLEQLQDEKQLTDRLPMLMSEFRTAVESLGFTY